MSCSGQTTPDVRVRIKYLGALRDATGKRVDEVAFPSGATLHDVADWLDERYDLAVPSPRVMAVLNGRGWEQLPERLATDLHDGDVIALFPPIAGG